MDGASSSRSNNNNNDMMVICTLKLFAVREKDQKLIGVVNFPIDYKSGKNTLKDHKVIQFQKCIDPKANITISARLLDIANFESDLPEPMTKVSIV